MNAGNPLFSAAKIQWVVFIRSKNKRRETRLATAKKLSRARLYNKIIIQYIP